MWPVAGDGTDTPLLYQTEFHFPDGKARLYPLEWLHPSETPDETYDFPLNNGRILEHFHEGIMTYKSVGITAKVPDTFAEVSAELAAERALERLGAAHLEAGQYRAAGAFKRPGHGL